MMRPAATIPLSKGKVAIVDAADYWWLVRMSWYARKSRTDYYAVRNVRENGGFRTFRMHRLITNCPSDMEVHHKNNNTLDNRRENLEVCTGRENLSYRKDGAMPRVRE
jgi:hypothetical protein